MKIESARRWREELMAAKSSSSSSRSKETNKQKKKMAQRRKIRKNQKKMREIPVSCWSARASSGWLISSSWLAFSLFLFLGFWCVLFHFTQTSAPTTIRWNNKGNYNGFSLLQTSICVWGTQRANNTMGRGMIKRKMLLSGRLSAPSSPTLELRFLFFIFSRGYLLWCRPPSIGVVV